MTTPHDVLSFIASDQLVDATHALHDVLGQKVLNALEDRKIDIANQLFPATAFEEPMTGEQQA